jgi:catechol 2,3-dioxygenase-like lactoylglutathione lyase family enzyme
MVVHASPSNVKLGNIIIMVSDLARSEESYRDTLGLKESGRVEGEFVFFDTGGVTFAIRATDRPVVAGDTEFSFVVPDIMSRYESLKSKVEFSQPPRPVTGSMTGDLYATDFRDPDGHLLSMTSWVPKQLGR